MKTNTNKLLKAAAVFAFVLTIGFTKATNSINGTEGIIETEKTIKRHFTFPNFFLPLNKTEKVEVIFTTSENGKVNFVLAKTENEILKKQIEMKFSELTLSKIKSNVAYSIVFNIKTL